MAWNLREINVGVQQTRAGRRQLISATGRHCLQSPVNYFRRATATAHHLSHQARTMNVLSEAKASDSPERRKAMDGGNTVRAVPSCF
jgi:hypothetical protein